MATTIICARCRKEVPRTGNSQLYCGNKQDKESCAYKAYLENKRKSQKRCLTQNPDGLKERNREYQRNKRARDKMLAPKLEAIAFRKMMPMPVEQILKNWSKFF